MTRDPGPIGPARVAPQLAALDDETVADRAGSKLDPALGVKLLLIAEDEIDLAVTILDEALHTVTERRAACVASSSGRL